MKFAPFLIASVVLAGCPVLVAYGDGLVANGHVNGAHTDLNLTPGQVASLVRGQKQIVLTAEQKKGLSKPVEKLLVFPSNTDTCTCELANVAVQVTPWTIEVANDLLGRDLAKEARENEARFRAEQAKKVAAENTHRGSKELALCEQANRCSFDNPVSAIALYEQALKINPHLSDAKIQLGCAWNNMGVQRERQGKFAEALSCFRKSLQFTDPNNKLLYEGAQANINRVQHKMPN